MKGNCVVGAGAALVDLLIEEKDSFLEKTGSPKGGMTLVDLEKIQSLLSQTTATIKTVPGGSACNTLVGIGQLGGEARMIGRVGKDVLGKGFTQGLKDAKVDYRLAESDSPTGRVLSVVTPDAQRTMFTCLGASAEFSPADINESMFADATIIHLEGYLLFNASVVDHIIGLKKQTGAQLALDLASFEVVAFTKDYLQSILPHVDILIANEDEAKAFTGQEEEKALEILSQHAKIAVVKLGKKGALISKGGEITRVQADVVTAVDTTGAGDLWASGFFYGLTHNYTLTNAGKLAAKVASEVVQVMGAVIPNEGWKRIHEFRKRLE